MAEKAAILDGLDDLLERGFAGALKKDPKTATRPSLMRAQTRPFLALGADRTFSPSDLVEKEPLEGCGRLADALP
jgi:hypothetical protein